MNTPVLFLPFLLTLTGRFTSCRAPHCGPVSRPGVFRVNVAGCDLNWRLCNWPGGAQPDSPPAPTPRRALRANPPRYRPPRYRAGRRDEPCASPLVLAISTPPGVERLGKEID